MSKIKKKNKTLDVFKSRLDNAEERIEHKGKETIHKEMHWEKCIKNKKLKTDYW